jgi:hypothetical protein
MYNFPKQRLPYSRKASSNFKWAKDVVDSILSYSPQDEGVVNKYNSSYQRKLSNYQLYNNQLNQFDFERECNPLGLDVGQFKDAIQPYNKTYNKIQILLSDESKRPFNFRTILVNAEGVRSKLSQRDAMLRNYIDSVIKQTISSLSDIYSPELLEVHQEHIINPKDLDKYMRYSYRERREILAQNILQYLYRKMDIKDIKTDAFKHALISGEEVVYVGTNGDEPHIEVINPLGFFYHKSGETKWIQKSLYAGYTTFMTQAEVLDRYGKYLSQEDIEKIDTAFGDTNALREFSMEQNAKYGNLPYDPVYHDTYTTTQGSYGKSSHTDVRVSHVEWVSQRKVGFLTMFNEYGEEETTIVSEDFEIPTEFTKEIVRGRYGVKTEYYIWKLEDSVYKLNWDYIPEVWTATKIGHDIYTMVGPKEVQFRSMDDPYDVSLGYHGIVYNATNAESVSLMDRMKPFQYLYFIVMHKLKKLIAQDQGKVFHFDVSMVDPKIGIEKTLYYLKEMNLDIFNPLANADEPGQAQRGKIASETDMSNMQYIMNYINILAALDNQISEVAGVSRQREGQTTPTEAVSNAQSNIQMSALITEIYFQSHAKMWEKSLTALIHVAQHVWKGKSIIKQYVLDDMSLSTLELSPEDVSNCDLGVFLTDSGKEYEMFSALKSISDGLLNTNRATFSDLITLYEANSSAELKAAIRQSEEETFKREQQSQQQQIEAAQQQQQAQQQFDIMMQDRLFEHKERLAQIEVFKFQKDIDIDNNGIPDPLEIQKFISDQNLRERELDLAEKKFEKESDLKEKDLKIKARKSSK